MGSRELLNFQRIAQAIDYLRLHFKEQPDLDTVARQVHMSPFHFQKMFTDWAGVSPKKFLQFVTAEYAKGVLRERGATLFDAVKETGLSGGGRLHDLFVNAEGMTPAEYKNGGENLTINYSYIQSPFGKLLVASTTKGVCYLAFDEFEMVKPQYTKAWEGRGESPALADLRKRFPQAKLVEKLDQFQQDASKIFTEDWTNLANIKFHLKGTPFQLKVWNALLQIPFGKLSTYGEIAASIKNPGASRAVGSAIGDNPISILIPCHRVVQSSGSMGHYYWGTACKAALIGWEAAKVAEEEIAEAD